MLERVDVPNTDALVIAPVRVPTVALKYVVEVENTPEGAALATLAGNVRPATVEAAELIMVARYVVPPTSVTDVGEPVPFHVSDVTPADPVAVAADHTIGTAVPAGAVDGQRAIVTFPAVATKI